MADVEPIITNEREYDEYQRKQMEDDLEARENPTPTQQYDSPIGPERNYNPNQYESPIGPSRNSFREKIESKIHGAGESIKSGIGNIKRNYEEGVEYERKRAKVEREVKSSPEYLKKKAEHELYMEEARVRKSSPRRGSTMATPSLITMGNYRPAYSGKSTIPSARFGGNYQPAYTGQIMSMGTPSVVKAPVKAKPVHVTSFGSGAMPKMGNFGGSSLMPKIGGMGKKLQTPSIGNFTFGEIPKIGKSITHKGSVKSIGSKTNIGVLGEVPKIQFGIAKKAPVKRRKTKRSKKR
jgi:hypothetical protein